MTQKIDSVSVFVDGASRGNPGPSSIGIVFQDEKGEILHSVAKPIGIATNNLAECMALTTALIEALAHGYKSLHVFTDSELMAKQYSGEYKIKDSSLRILFFLIREMAPHFKRLQVSHIGREKNQLADQKANEALDNKNLLL